MRVKLTVLVAAIVILAGAGDVVAHEDESHGHDDKGTMVRGEILDMACYVAHEAKGPDHAACAKRCVKGGQPMGLLAEDGTVYLLYANHEDGSAFEQAKGFAGQKVEIVGIAATKAGIKGLVVSSVKKL